MPLLENRGKIPKINPPVRDAWGGTMKNEGIHMASEYLLKKYKDVKPDEVRTLTKKEKWRNWWYYHKWHVVVAVLAAVCIGNLLWNALGIGETKPDYSIAYVGRTPLSEETAEALRSGFAALSSDLNGDGKVTVELLQYVGENPADLDNIGSAGSDSEDSTDINNMFSNNLDSVYSTQAAQIQLIADITECKSYFFLLEDPAGFQERTAILCNLDGSLPDDEDRTPDGKYVLLGDCPMLAQIELGAARETVSQLSFARRGFWTEKTVTNCGECDALWDTLTAGAKKP